MAKNVTSMGHKADLPPGALVYVGEPTDAAIETRVIKYDREFFQEIGDVGASAMEKLLDAQRVNWVRVRGVHDVGTIRAVGKVFGLHPLVLEDILNTNHRPKFEDFGDYHFLVLKTLELDMETMRVRRRHLCLVVGENYLLSFSDGPDDPFEPVARRLAGGKSRMRRLGSFYLSCMLLDVVVDSFFRVLDELDDPMEDIEQEVLTDPSHETLAQLYRFRRIDMELHKAVRPLREVVGGVMRSDSEMVDDASLPFLRDVDDHISHVFDEAQNLRYTVNGLIEMHLSSTGNRLNEVMKVLTIVATVFMPLTFITGVYGMNFKYMPELDVPWAYPATLGVMAVLIVLMLVFFRSRKWI